MDIKLSIITINYNNKEGLEKTIESVVAQTTREFEYIVIDGGSTDGSVEVIKKYAEYIDYWVSEPDKGIYNAMNKGVQKAHGRFCQFLNSGDWLYSNIVVECILPYFNTDRDIIVGIINCIKEDGSAFKNLRDTPKELNLLRLLRYPLPHQACFIRTKLLLENPYNESLKIVSDWEFCVNAYLSGAKFARIPFDVAYFSLGGISSSIEALHQEQTQKSRDVVHPQFLAEIEKTPVEIINLFNQIPSAYRFKHLICTIDKFLVKIYSIFKKTVKNEKYVCYPPQFC